MLVVVQVFLHRELTGGEETEVAAGPTDRRHRGSA